MPYARIYINKEKKQKNIDIKELRDFWKTYSSPGDAAKKVFRFMGKDDQLISCQVLRIAETMDELNEKVAAKRSRVPKLNATAFEEIDDNCDDKPQTVRKNKKQKTEETNAKTSAQIETIGEILHAYQKASETATNTVSKREVATKRTNKDVATKETERSKNGDIAYHQKEKQVFTANKMGIFEDHSCASENAYEDFQLTMSHTANDSNDHVTLNEDPHIFRLDISPNEDLDKCYKNIADLESELTRWKKKYDDLQSSQQYPLTEATGQRILAVLNAVQNGSAFPERRLVEDKTIRMPIHTNITNTSTPIRVEGKDISICAEDEAISTKRVGSQPDDVLDLGSGINIKVSVYDSFAKQKKPSQFVSSLAQYIWGVKTLANRSVRYQANVRQPQLEDDKKGILIREFRHWLLRKRYPAERLEDEMDSLSKYLNSAITSSRRRIERENALQSEEKNGGTGKVLKNQKNSTRPQQHPKLDLIPPRKKRWARSTQGKVNKATLKKLRDFERVSESSQSDNPESVVVPDVDSEAHNVLDSASSDGSYSELSDSLSTVHGYQSDESVERLLRNIGVDLPKTKSKNSNAGRKIYSGGSNEATRKKRVRKTSKGSLHASESEPETIVIAEPKRFKFRKHHKSDTHSKARTLRSSTTLEKGNSGGSREGMKKIEEKNSQNVSGSETESGLFSRQERCKSREQLELNVDSNKEASQSLTTSKNAKCGDSAGDGAKKNKAVSKISKRDRDTSETDRESETMVFDSAEHDMFEESEQSHSNVDSNGKTSHSLTVSNCAKSEN